jgi:hypothetical protein
MSVTCLWAADIKEDTQMKFSPKAQANLDRMVKRFKAGDLSPVVAIAKVKLPDDAPARRWTFSNQVMAFAQSNCVDNRGYNQWQDVGRQVNQPGAAFILGPHMVKDKDADDPDAKKCVGFIGIAVHPYDHTEPIDGADNVFTYEPREMPPLHEAAERLGIKIDWSAMRADLYGWCGNGKIGLGSYDAGVFFHELAHAAHRSFEAKTEAGQDPKGEAVAEFTAAVLMELYGLGDRSGNAWSYIKQYNPDPLRAIQTALADVKKVLDIILNDEA